MVLLCLFIDGFPIVFIRFVLLRANDINVDRFRCGKEDWQFCRLKKEMSTRLETTVFGLESLFM